MDKDWVKEGIEHFVLSHLHQGPYPFNSRRTFFIAFLAADIPVQLGFFDAFHITSISSRWALIFLIQFFWISLLSKTVSHRDNGDPILPKLYAKKVPEQAKAYSPKVQSFESILNPAPSSQDPELYHLIVTRNKTAPQHATPLNSSLFLSMRSSRAPIPHWLLDHLC